MSEQEPLVTYLELRESADDGEARAGLSHTAAGLVLLHVQELAAYGVPRGAVTIVHDAGEHGGRYLDVARRLARGGWAIALPDMRGHGRSEGERGHSAGIKEVLRDLGDIQDHLAYRQPDAPKILVGQGLGALYCLAYACERSDSVAGLVLSAPLLTPRFDLPAQSGGLAKLFRRVGPKSPGRIGYHASQLSGAKQYVQSRAEDPLVHDVITLGAGTEAEVAAGRYRGRMSELGMPILILQGTADLIAPPASLVVVPRPNIEVRSFDGLLHDLFHDTRSDEVIQVVERWLDRAAPRS